MSEWIKWHGGECPVNRDTIVEVLLGAGSRGINSAGEYFWQWRLHGGGGDIICYRVVKPCIPTVRAVNDPIEHPTHYTSHPSGIECIQITEHMGFNLGNAVKYIWRADLKHDDALEDLRKAVWYIEREIAKRGK